MKSICIVVVNSLFLASCFADEEPILPLDTMVARGTLVVSGVLKSIHETSVEKLQNDGIATSVHHCQAESYDVLNHPDSGSHDVAVAGALRGVNSFLRTLALELVASKPADKLPLTRQSLAIKAGNK